MKKTNGRKLGKAVTTGGNEGAVLVQWDRVGARCKRLFGIEMQKRSDARRELVKEKSKTLQKKSASESSASASPTKDQDSTQVESSSARPREQISSASSRRPSESSSTSAPVRTSAFGAIPDTFHGKAPLSGSKTMHNRNSPWKRSLDQSSSSQSMSAPKQSNQAHLRMNNARQSTSPQTKYLRNQRHYSSSSTSDSETDDLERARREDRDKVFYPRSTARVVSGGRTQHISPLAIARKSAEAIAAENLEDKERARRHVEENGFAYLTINKADLAILEKGRRTSDVEAVLKVHFRAFQPGRVSSINQEPTIA